MPITTYDNSSQDYAVMDEDSYSFISIQNESSNIIPESSSATGLSSQLGLKYQPDSEKWLVITKDEITQTRATMILGKVSHLVISLT
jgi:hypothetical protein